MDVQLLIHLENADGTALWWAESAEVPGFSATAESLVELRDRARAALEEIAAERGEVLGLTERLAGTDSDSYSPPAVVASVGP